MKYGLRRTVFALLFLSLIVSSVSAQWFDGSIIFNRNPRQPRIFHQHQGNWSPEFRGFPSYEAYRYYMNERYPKFYGGFHSNYYHNMGIPAGDIGIRGNGIYPAPWSY